MTRWFKDNPVRAYLMSLALAVFPLTLFLIAAHQLLVRQSSQKILAQSTKTGAAIGNVIQHDLVQSRTLLESFATRQGLVAAATSKDWSKVQQHLEQARALQPDFVFFGVFDPAGTLQAIYPRDVAIEGKNFAFRDWYKGVAGSQRSYVSEVYQTSAGKHPSV